MIPRVLEKHLRGVAGKFPVVTITGPRQSGKTTLCRSVFAQKPYVSLEAPDVHAFAAEDPRGFLAGYPDGAVLDEVHRTPDLLSYIQTIVDARPVPGLFILTGSANFALLRSISQSLAGRTALLTLLPLSLDEVRRFPRHPSDLWEVLWKGSFPAIYDRGLDPDTWYAGYVGTYVERDVRMVLNIGDLLAFQTFLRLCAGRTSQLVNLSALGADAGITHATAKSWLSVLETGYVTWRVPPLHANLRKRLIKTPKLHFLDTGLLCYLLGIRSAQQLAYHPLRGAIFETWVASEILKARLHRGKPPNLFFFRDRKGMEVDLIVELGRMYLAVETKSSHTIAEDFFVGVRTFKELMETSPSPRRVKSYVIYGGTTTQRRTAATVLPWSAIDTGKWWKNGEA
ncbi:MAG: ATP-binding protein [Nitrospirae bacterium]|nr:MAG: ATP-binding protein [Nitrospirota bacterium]